MDIVLHIGIQRTGSTFLQNEVFRKLENINFIGFWSRESFDTIFSVIGESEPSFSKFKLIKSNIYFRLYAVAYVVQ